MTDAGEVDGAGGAEGFLRGAGIIRDQPTRIARNVCSPARNARYRPCGTTFESAANRTRPFAVLHTVITSDQTPKAPQQDLLGRGLHNVRLVPAVGFEPTLAGS